MQRPDQAERPELVIDLTSADTRDEFGLKAEAVLLDFGRRNSVHLAHKTMLPDFEQVTVNSLGNSIVAVAGAVHWVVRF